MLLLLVALAPQSVSQDSLSCDSSRVCCFPQHKHTRKPSGLLSLMLLLFMLQYNIPMHNNFSLFLTAPKNTCPSTPIAGHTEIPTKFFVTGKIVFTSYTSSSCSSGLLAALPALLCKYLRSFTNTTPALWLFY